MKKLLFTVIIFFGIAVTASAQEKSTTAKAVVNASTTSDADRIAAEQRAEKIKGETKAKPVSAMTYDDQKNNKEVKTALPAKPATKSASARSVKRKPHAKKG